MLSERSERRFEPFLRLPSDARERHLAGYLAFLRELDGAIDLPRRRLAQRERYFEEIERKPVESQDDVDEASFERNFAKAGSGGLDRRTAWLVVAAKANTGEAYGVERELAWLGELEDAPTSNELHLRMLLQEAYHTRILHEACRTAGIEVHTPLPHWNQRVLIETIMRLPDAMRWTLVICGEVVGCAIFEMLIENCEVFSAEPAVEARLRSLLLEIWRDEVLHVAYLRALLGPVALGCASRLLPLVARAALLDLPELERLGATRRSFLARVRSGLGVPPDASWMEPDPA